MGEKNVTPERMLQGGITPLVLPGYIPFPRTPLLQAPYTSDKKQTVQQQELPGTALIQIGNGYFGGQQRYSLVLECEIMCLS